MGVDRSVVHTETLSSVAVANQSSNQGWSQILKLRFFAPCSIGPICVASPVSGSAPEPTRPTSIDRNHDGFQNKNCCCCSRLKANPNTILVWLVISATLSPGRKLPQFDLPIGRSNNERHRRAPPRGRARYSIEITISDIPNERLSKPCEPVWHSPRLLATLSSSLHGIMCGILQTSNTIEILIGTFHPLDCSVPIANRNHLRRHPVRRSLRLHGLLGNELESVSR